LVPLLVLGTLATVLAWWESNETSTDALKTETSASIPLPGYDWLTRISSPDTEFTWNGITYSSAFDAMLYGNPAAYACRNFNCWLNNILFSPKVAAWFIQKTGSIELGHYLLCYVRNLIGGCLVYYGTAAAFSYFCYMYPPLESTWDDRKRPTRAIIWDQIRLAQASLFIYTMLPVLDEYLVENGYTKVYFTVQEIGGMGMYILSHLFYFSLVEIGIYWMHRTLHTNKFLYKHVHMLHHKYNRPDTLTPWASIAFHPLDGILQASPYVLFLPIAPCHYVTHVAMLFFTAIWATYIHDSMDFNVWEIMGSKYHTVHHTHYIYNYGQVFTFCDRFWGTFKEPEGPTGVTGKYKKAA
jgi:lathosterol oxidase